MRKLIYLLFSLVGFVLPTRGEDIHERVVRTATVKMQALIRQNELNNLAGIPENNIYVVTLNAEDILRGDTIYFHQRVGSSEDNAKNYVSDERATFLNDKLREIFRITKISPYLLIINNMPLVLDRKLYEDNAKLSALFKADAKGSESQAAEKVTIESQKIGYRIETALASKLHKAVFIGLTRFIGVYEGVSQEVTKGFYEAYYTKIFELDASVRGLIYDQVQKVGAPDKETRAAEFVSAMKQGLEKYAVTGAGREFRSIYAGVITDQNLLEQLVSLIDQMGGPLYEQYLNEVNGSTNGYTNEDFQRFYNDLSAYWQDFEKWRQGIGVIKDPNNILMTYLYTRDRGAWYEKLSITERKRLLDIFDAGALSSSGNVFAPIFKAKQGGEDFVLLLISKTPAAQQEELLQKLAENNNKMLISLVSKIDGSNFVVFVNTLTKFIMDVYPNKSTMADLIISHKVIGYDGAFFGPARTKDFDENGNVTLSVRKNFHFNYEFKPPPLSPYDYVLIDFRSDYKLGKEVIPQGTKLALPSIFCYYLFNSVHNKQLAVGGKIALNLAFFTISAGALNSALLAGDGAAVCVAAIDLGIIGTDIVVDGCEDYLEKHNPGFLKAWRGIMGAYIAGRVSLDLAKFTSEASFKSQLAIEREAEFTALTLLQQEQIRQINAAMKVMLKMAGVSEEVAAGIVTSVKQITSAVAKEKLPQEFVDAMKAFGKTEEEIFAYFAKYHNSTGFFDVIEQVVANSVLTREEVFALWGYTTNFFYGDLNALLRAGSAAERTAEITRLLKAALSKLQKSGKVYDNTRSAYRAIELHGDALISFLNKHKVGDVVTYGDFISAGGNKFASFMTRANKNIKIEIAPKTATDISAYGDGIYFREMDIPELLFGPGLKFEILKVESLGGDIYYVTMREL